MSVQFRSGMRGACRAMKFAQALTILMAAASIAATSALAQTTPFNSLTLLWLASGDDGNQGQVSSYQLRYSTSPVGSDTTTWWNSTVPPSQRLTLGPPLAPAGAPDSTTVTGLTPGTTYYFILRALDETSNISDYSNVASGTTATCSAPTAAPALFDAVADTGQVSVSWGTTSDPLAVSLHLYRAQGTTGSWSQIRDLSVGTISFVDTAVSPGTTYRYRAAYMGPTCEGPSTATKTVTLPGTPAPPPPPPSTASASKIHVYPNPASGSLRIVVDVQSATPMAVDIRLYDMSGRWVATVVDGTYPPGSTEVPWNRAGRGGQTVAPGYYELLGSVGNTRVRERLVLLP
ncbi:MAG: hypothetical protein AAB011_14110 [Candidatus Eisenbacteria bacterium]